MTITAEQIARKIGISNATVSRVLNNSQNVSPETREAVLAVVRQSGGVPRVLGRRPKRNVKKQAAPQAGLVEILMVNRFPIAHIEPDSAFATNDPTERIGSQGFFSPPARLATSYMRHIINGIIDELRHFNMRAVVQVCENLTSPALLSEVNHPNNHGLFLLGGFDVDVPDFIAKCRCPVVTYSSWYHNGWPDYIGIDNFNGIRMAFEHLRQLGHTKIGYVAGYYMNTNPVYNKVFHERLVAYKACLTDANLPYRPEWVVDGVCELKPMLLGAETVLQLPDRPTAFVCCFDGAAVSVRRAAERVGLQVPRDLSIVGFDDEDIAQLMTPALTTVRVPTALMGRQGVHLMLLRQQVSIKPGEALNIRVSPTLIVRQSTAAPLAS